MRHLSHGRSGRRLRRPHVDRPMSLGSAGIGYDLSSDHPRSVAVPGPYIAEGLDNGYCTCFFWSMTPFVMDAG